MSENEFTNREKQLRFEVELAMQAGGEFDDGMSPAQAVDIVKNREPLVIHRRHGRSHRRGAFRFRRAA